VRWKEAGRSLVIDATIPSLPIALNAQQQCLARSALTTHLAIGLFDLYYEWPYLFL
jgi:hypothetical protein